MNISGYNSNNCNDITIDIEDSYEIIYNRDSQTAPSVTDQWLKQISHIDDLVDSAKSAFVAGLRLKGEDPQLIKSIENFRVTGIFLLANNLKEMSKGKMGENLSLDKITLITSTSASILKYGVGISELGDFLTSQNPELEIIKGFTNTLIKILRSTSFMTKTASLTKKTLHAETLTIKGVSSLLKAGGLAYLIGAPLVLSDPPLIPFVATISNTAIISSFLCDVKDVMSPPTKPTDPAPLLSIIIE